MTDNAILWPKELLNIADMSLLEMNSSFECANTPRMMCYWCQKLSESLITSIDQTINKNPESSGGLRWLD